ncbi:MAG: hypothetical protein ACK4S4_08410 [Pyrinomonadaceae bacterium]
MHNSEKPKTEIPQKPEERAGENWVDDQRRRAYYYDDAHGYETFDPDNDEDAGSPSDKDSADGMVSRP